MSCKYAVIAATLTEDELAKIAALPAAKASKLIGVGPTTIKDHRRGECMCGKAKKLSSKASKNVRVLTLDIENKPATVNVWSLYKVTVGINQIIEPSAVFGVGYKWYDEGKAHFLSDHHDGHEAMIRKTHALLSEADIVVSWNGQSFDLPHLNREFIMYGLTPPKPYKQIDLLRTARKQFNFQSNKLDWVAQQLGVGKKLQHTGHDLWTRCVAGDEDAWALMARYCRQDVVLTEKLLDILRPWVPNMPHLGQWTGDAWCCPSCGHADISKHRDGTSHAFVQQYRQYSCPRCGTWVRGTKKLLGPTETRQARIN